MKSQFFIAMLLLILTSCSSKQKQTTLIVKSKSQQEIEYSVSRIQFNIYPDTIRINQNNLPPNKQNTVVIPISKPSFAQTEINNVFYTLFLEPGNKLQITVTDSSAIFSGDGSNANNYLLQTSKFWQKCHLNVAQHITKPPKEYGYFLDSVSTALEKLNSSYLKKSKIKKETWEIIEVKNNAELILLKTIHKLVHPTAYNFLDSLPSSLLSIYKNLPLNKKYLDLGMVRYFNVLELYNRYEIIFPLTLDTSENDSTTGKIPLVAYQKIKENDNLDPLKDFLLAKYTSYWLSEKGITPTIDSIYYDYKRAYVNSQYLASLETQYSKFYALTPGQPAPEISGVNINGDTITLSSLKGKVVFVDVWATWCGSCITEFPYYSSIQEKFKDNKEVVFMFVSKDSEKEKWKDYIENKMKVTGIQLLEVETDTHPNISLSYKLWGIPHYILIDKEGNIAINKAPRPSSGKVIKEIEKLL